jgi:hypothetical protein
MGQGVAGPDERCSLLVIPGENFCLELAGLSSPAGFYQGLTSLFQPLDNGRVCGKGVSPSTPVISTVPLRLIENPENRNARNRLFSMVDPPPERDREVKNRLKNLCKTLPYLREC